MARQIKEMLASAQGVAEGEVQFIEVSDTPEFRKVPRPEAFNRAATIRNRQAREE